MNLTLASSLFFLVMGFSLHLSQPGLTLLSPSLASYFPSPPPSFNSSSIPFNATLPSSPLLSHLSATLSSLPLFSELSASFSSNPSFYIFFSLYTSAILFFLYLINRPIFYFRRLEEVGYIGDGRHPLTTIAQNARKRRMGGNTPPPFPNGWYFVAFSDDIEKGQVKEVTALGKQVAVFRADDGTAHVVDAYCPHMGASFAAGGTVKGNSVQCPFHGWSFDGATGKCTSIPYSSSPIPEFAKTTSHACKEMNGMIMIWFDAEGREPYWVPSELPKVRDGLWKRTGQAVGYVNCHIQEIPENGADVAHLAFLHSPFIGTGTDLRFSRRYLSIVEHEWHASWKPLEDEKHVGNLQLLHVLKIFGKRVPALDFKVNARQEGPALVSLTFEFLLGRGAFFQALVPEEPMLQKIIHTVYTDWWIPTFVGRFMLLMEITQVERDMMVWNNKAFVSKPMLVKEDKLIGMFRRWYAQFYSEHSADFGQKNNSDW